MTTVDPKVLEALGLTQSRPKAENKKDELGQDDFLKLMTAQLNNQDPMKPMENGEFLSQMAQFGTVDGINKLQQSFNQLSGALHSNQALQASSLVGRSVMVPSDQALLVPGENVVGSVELPEAATDVKLKVFDQSGELVKTIELGTHEAGKVNFQWNGLDESGETMPPGTYEIKAVASIDGTDEGVSTLVRTNVDSVTLGNGQEGLTLNLRGIGTVSFADVRELL